VLFTDGVSEAGPDPDRFFDVAGIAATIGASWGRPASELCDALLDEVVRRSHGRPRDDATVLVLKFD
jgi:serine phosphatase RsbU (regulator of sigma subunit)